MNDKQHYSVNGTTLTMFNYKIDRRKLLERKDKLYLLKKDLNDEVLNTTSSKSKVVLNQI